MKRDPTVMDRARKAAARVLPRGGDEGARQVLIDYFVAGFGRGYAAAKRERSPRSGS